jgi:CheY-like chemotaxis protein
MNTGATAAEDHGCVLIVDDEEDVRESVRDVVELVGCSALMAASATEALALLAHRRPCLVILDILMPGMTGLQLLEEIRRTPELSGLSVVMSTSAPERAPAGVMVLPKPLDIDAFSKLMQRRCQCALPD